MHLLLFCTIAKCIQQIIEKYFAFYLNLFVEQLENIWKLIWYYLFNYCVSYEF